MRIIKETETIVHLINARDHNILNTNQARTRELGHQHINNKARTLLPMMVRIDKKLDRRTE